jgi:hypothetical protein
MAMGAERIHALYYRQSARKLHAMQINRSDFPEGRQCPVIRSHPAVPARTVFVRYRTGGKPGVPANAPNFAPGTVYHILATYLLCKCEDNHPVHFSVSGLSYTTHFTVNPLHGTKLPG